MTPAWITEALDAAVALESAYAIEQFTDPVAEAERRYLDMFTPGAVRQILAMADEAYIALQVARGALRATGGDLDGVSRRLLDRIEAGPGGSDA